MCNWLSRMPCVFAVSDGFSLIALLYCTLGTIESCELKYVMNKLGEEPNDDELEDMIRAVDLNGDGVIDFEEFIGLMRLRMDERQRDPEEDLRDAFNMFDADRSGYIDREEVRALMKKLAQTLTDEEIDAIMEEVDTDGDGEISFEEFRAMMFS
jgi:Ca2+-binding EF-hand superfamily protein